MNDFVEHLKGRMSLREPQSVSLEILDKILSILPLKKEQDLEKALATVNDLFPICSDFERDFMSLTFALATGVGKTRLMGAFIAYLYMRHNVHNFFVVAPNTTIYDKLKKDLGDVTNPKYVFNGLDCFAGEKPAIIDGDNYNAVNMFGDKVKIYVFNIDKINSDDGRMRRLNEVIGDSFYDYLTKLNDLVVIMDESHHYRAKQGAKAINGLKPVLGLELTATPVVMNGSKGTKFKNVVYEYPLSRAIADGFTRTPYALARGDLNLSKVGDEERDKLMLNDGIDNHERIRAELLVYAQNNNERIVKPFVLIVCKDTQHAEWVKSIVCSKNFRDGYYINRTIMVHSNQRGGESDANKALLLSVENADNPVEIVIHVNMLKEGWDVNNLYTIIPLRTATSSVLREQMVGRGLRLPYGERTHNDRVDSVVLTAHDKFQEILDEAQKGNSIFKRGNIIEPENHKPVKVKEVQISLNFPDKNTDEVQKQLGLTDTEEAKSFLTNVERAVSDELAKASGNGDMSEVDAVQVAKQAKEILKDNQTIGDLMRENENVFNEWLTTYTENVKQKTIEKYIPIPLLEVREKGTEEFVYEDFDLDMEKFANYQPVEHKVLYGNLLKGSVQYIEGSVIKFDDFNQLKEIVSELRKFPEIDYETDKELMVAKIKDLSGYLIAKFGEDGMKNVVMMYKAEFAKIIYEQMMAHRRNIGDLHTEEEIGKLRPYNLRQRYTFEEELDLNSSDFQKKEIGSILFTGIKKGVFTQAKFDSEPEHILARVLEGDGDVLNWLRPASKEFDIQYGGGKNYEPDFVVETEDCIYLTEVKGDDKLQDDDVLLKKERALTYCEKATEWGRKKGYKEWKYLFIPSSKINLGVTFSNLVKCYAEVDRMMVRKEHASVRENEDVISVGDEVYDKVRGSGTVIEVLDSLITVDFGGNRKKYPIPQAFENGHLEKLM